MSTARAEAWSFSRRGKAPSPKRTFCVGPHEAPRVAKSLAVRGLSLEPDAELSVHRERSLRAARGGDEGCGVDAENEMTDAELHEAARLEVEVVRVQTRTRLPGCARDAGG